MQMIELAILGAENDRVRALCACLCVISQEPNLNEHLHLTSDQFDKIHSYK